MARERVEDLGRVSVLIRNVLELDIFDLYQGRNKDFPEYFACLSDDQKYDLLRKIIYGIEELENLLGTVSEIADGCDVLNADSIF